MSVKARDYPAQTAPGPSQRIPHRKTLESWHKSTDRNGVVEPRSETGELGGMAGGRPAPSCVGRAVRPVGRPRGCSSPGSICWVTTDAAHDRFDLISIGTSAWRRWSYWSG
jgi:hypothetical protein